MDNEKRPLTEKDVYKKALKRRTRYRIPSANPAVIITVVLFLAIIAVCAVVIAGRDGGNAPGIVTGTITLETDETGVITEAVTEADKSIKITLTADDVHRGELVLVNADHEFRFPETRDDVSVYDNKSPSYKVGDRTVTLSMTTIDAFNKLMDDFYAQTACRDVMIVSGGGYRSEEYQRQLYTDRVASQGAEAAARYVALPGNSEHHTGLAMDLTVYTDSGEGHTLRTYEKCAWLVDNFENYGFSMRYPEEKEDITGIGYESWHYRYVGVPHSLIMKEKNMCFEEYVEYLHTIPEGKAVFWNGTSSLVADIEDSLNFYAVYYVAASAVGDTKITIPEGREYTVSGDNVSGFIITLLPVNGGQINE